MELEDMKGAIILLALIALIGAASSIALDDFQGGIQDDATRNTIVNESITSLTNASVVTCISVDTSAPYYALLNLSGGAYTRLDGSNLTITFGGDITYYYEGSSGNTSLFNYDCITRDNAYNITGVGLVSIDNSTSYLDTIGTIIGVAILIGIVILAFTFSRR